MPPAARVGDMHVCPMVTGIVPHVGGPVIPPCAITVLTGGVPQARVGDMATCVGPPDVIVLGSMGVFVMGSPAARMFDPTAHGGKIMIGLPTVMIGEIGGGSPSAGGMSMLVPGDPPMSAESNPDVAQMVQTMIAAGVSGTPFCEQCQKS
jgi:uncharacterized Zn-binding protein involved in type VI secretion